MNDKRLKTSFEKRLSSFNLSIDIEIGPEIFVMFGPSGAGKTQTLNAIAGLTAPDAGEITLDGATFFRHKQNSSPVNIPARHRAVGYVFQHYALFPHLTALENVGYSVWRESDGRDRAFHWLERMRLDHLADRYPNELSGGQQQRVAIARALASEPEVLLLDEPFSALDAPLRTELNEEMRRLQAESDLIVVYVTHNLDDALAVGHRMAVIREGKIEQIGSISDVMEHPANRTVLEILGVPNIFRARVAEIRSDGVLLDWDGLILESSFQTAKVDEIVHAYIRPEEIEMRSGDHSKNRVIGIITHRQPARSFNLLRVKLCNKHEIDVHVQPSIVSKASVQIGQEIHLILPHDQVKVVPG